ncbi:hypothetical protein D3C72_2230340 [compost metagenome]
MVAALGEDLGGGFEEALAGLLAAFFAGEARWHGILLDIPNGIRIPLNTNWYLSTERFFRRPHVPAQDSPD